MNIGGKLRAADLGGLPSWREIGMFAPAIVPQPLQAQLSTDDAQVWQRSATPLTGRMIRVGTAVLGLGVGLAVAGPSGVVLAGLAMVPLLAAPFLTARWLRARQSQISARVDGRTIARLNEMRGHWVVRYFAPHAWAPLFEARVQLQLGNGRAAARAFADTQRLSALGTSEALVLGRAEGHLIAGEKKEAVELLDTYAQGTQLSANAHLLLGVAYLGDSGRAKMALAPLTSAQSTLGDDPRCRAALVLAQDRHGKSEDVARGLAEIKDLLDAAPGQDTVLADLLKRVRKLARSRERASGKRRSAKPVATTAAKPSSHATSVAESRKKKERKKRKSKREREREKKRGDKRNKPIDGKSAQAPQLVASRRPGAPIGPGPARGSEMSSRPATPRREPKSLAIEVSVDAAVVASTVALPPVPTVSRTRFTAPQLSQRGTTATQTTPGLDADWDAILEDNAQGDQTES